MSLYKALVFVAGVATLLASGDVLGANAIDAQSSTTLTIGGSNASALSVSKSGVTTTVNGSLTVSETLTANKGSGTSLAVTNNMTVGGTTTASGAIYADAGIDRSSTASWTLFGTNGTSGSIGRSGQTVTFPGNVTISGSLSASFSPVVASLTTSGLSLGDIGYNNASAATMAKAQSDGTRLQATVFGVNDGNSGEMIYAGSATINMTTAGGSPSNGAVIWLAASTDDTNAGAGKATATEPTTGYSVELGICIDNSDYSGSKTVLALFRPAPLVKLS